MTNPSGATPPVVPIVISDYIIEKMQAKALYYKHIVEAVVALSSLALGFATFIAIQAPIRQAAILKNQDFIIKEISESKEMLASLSAQVKRMSDRLEELGGNQ